MLLVAQTKEAGAVPFSPGDGLGDFRQAAVSPPLPNKALVEHRDPVMLPLHSRVSIVPGDRSRLRRSKACVRGTAACLDGAKSTCLRKRTVAVSRSPIVSACRR